MKLGIITGSTRQGRQTGHLADIVTAQAKKLSDTEVKVLDLREYDLPMFDEAISPKYNPNRQPSEPVKQWLDDLTACDAFVLVSPEYNRAIPGVLKNAFDHIAHEVNDKPFALISHGSYSGGFALAALRVIVPELGGISIPHMIGLPYGPFDQSGAYTGDLAALTDRLDAQLADLQRYSDTLASVRV